MKFLCPLLFLLLPNLLFSQTLNNYTLLPENLLAPKEPLIELLKELEQKHDVKFNYVLKWVKNIKAYRLSDDLPLEETLYKLTASTAVTFQKKEENVYIIPRDKIEIKGVITDRLSLEPIPDIHITFEIASSGGITDTDGRFSIKDRFCPNDFMIISHVNLGEIRIPYKDWQKNNINNISINFGITLDTLQIIQIFEPQNVSFTNSKQSITIPLSGMGSYVKDRDVMRTIQTIAGVNSPDDLASSFQFRGSNSFQNLVLWDGIPLYKYGNMFGMASAFSNSLIDTVTVDRNGTDITTGGRTSGVVNLQTTNKIPNRTKIGIGLSLIHTEAHVKIPLFNKKSALFFSYKRPFLFKPTIDKGINSTILAVYGDYISQAVIGGDLVKNSRQIKGGNTFPEFSFEEINAKWLFKSDNLGIINLSLFNQKDELAILYGGTHSYYKTLQRGVVSNWKNTWKNKLMSSVSLSGLRYDFGEYDNLFNYNFISYSPNSFLFLNDEEKVRQLINNRNITDKYTAKVNFKQTLAKNKEIVFGIESNIISRKITQRADLDTLFNYLVEEKTSEKPNFEGGTDLTLYSSYYFRKNKFESNLGIRNTYNFRYKRFFPEPRIQVNYTLDTITTLKAAVGFSHQVEGQPIAFQSNLDIIKWKYWTNIKPITSRIFSVGMIKKNNDWVLDIEAYFKQTKDISHRIGFLGGQVYSPVQNTSGRYIRYLSSQTNFGIDALFQTIIKNKHTLQLGYSWIYSSTTLPVFSTPYYSSTNETKESTGKIRLPNFQSPHQFKGQLIAFNNRPVQFVIDMLFFAARTNHFSGYVINYNRIDKRKFAPQKRLDFSLIVNTKIENIFHSNKTKFVFSIRDIFNQGGVPGIASFVDSNSLDQFDQFSLGTTINFSFFLEW